MRKLFLLSGLMLTAAGAFCQVVTPTTKWMKTYGGSGIDYMYALRQTSDMGYVMVGYSESTDSMVSGGHGMSDVWVCKTDSSGVVQWTKAIGGSDVETAYDIRETKDGGYIIAASTNSASGTGNVTGQKGGKDAYLVKLRSGGSIHWTKCLGGSNDESARSVWQTPDNGYIFAGTSGKANGDVTSNHGVSGADDIWVVKTDSQGNIQWQKSYGGSSTEEAASIAPTADGGYLICGTTNSNDTLGDVTLNKGSEDYWVFKINVSGTLLWQRTLGGSGVDKGTRAWPTKDGGSIVAGFVVSNDSNVTNNHTTGTNDYWLVKLDKNAKIVWQKTFGGTGEDFAQDVIITSDNGYLLTGYAESNDGDMSGNKGSSDFWVLKLDSNAAIQWKKNFGGQFYDQAYMAVQTNDGGYAIGGYTYSSDQDITGAKGEDDYWLVRLGPDGSAPKVDPKGIRRAGMLQFSVYPNPAKEQVMVQAASMTTVEMSDANGKLIATQTSAAGQTTLSLNIATVAPGMYFIKATDRNGSYGIQKLLVY